MWKRLVKTLVPRRLFSYARKKVIVAKQHKAAALLKGLVDDCDAGRIEKPDIKAQAIFPDDRPIIWQYWAQGMENVPPMVRICMDSVDRWAASDFRIIRLCDDNLADYIEIPTWLNERVGKKIISTAHFSDILTMPKFTLHLFCYVTKKHYIKKDVLLKGFTSKGCFTEKLYIRSQR